MNNTIARKLGPALGPVILLYIAGAPASASTLDFEQTPVTDAVAQIDRAFGANIVVSDRVDIDRMVTFSVSDIEGDGARLQAVSTLANALGVDYHKVFLVSKIADGSTPPDPGIDATTAPVVLADPQMPAEDAIKLVAGIDDANVEFYSPLHSVVTFPDTQLSDGDAANDIARQTHTLWKAFYYLTPRSGRGLPPGSEIVGYTDGGQPITALTGDSFRSAQTVPVAVPDASGQQGTAAPVTGANGSAAGQAATANGAQGQQGLPQYSIQVPPPFVFGGQNANGALGGYPYYGLANGMFNYGPAGSSQSPALSPGFSTSNGALNLLPNYGAGSAFGAPLTVP